MCNKSVVIFLLILVSFINITGCSNEDARDIKISSLQQEVLKLEQKNSELIEKVANLSKEVGIGKKQYFEEKNIGIAQVIVISTLLFIVFLFFIYRKFSKNEKIYQKEKKELNEKNSTSQELILDLEHEIKQLKRDLEDGEKNEVSNLLKSLKSERELKKQKVGGLGES